MADNSNDQVNFKDGFVYLDDLDEDGFIAQLLREFSELNDTAFVNKADEIMAEHNTNFYAMRQVYYLNRK